MPGLQKTAEQWIKHAVPQDLLQRRCCELDFFFFVWPANERMRSIVIMIIRYEDMQRDATRDRPEAPLTPISDE